MGKRVEKLALRLANHFMPLDVEEELAFGLVEALSGVGFEEVTLGFP